MQSQPGGFRHFLTTRREPGVENALVLAGARRLIPATDAAPLGTIRSLAYFLPVIDEVLELRVNPEYFRYLRQKVERGNQTR